MQEGTRQFEMEIEIAAPRDAVWKALAEATELRRWFPLAAEAGGEVGGEVVWSWGEKYTWKQTIDVLEAGERLRTRYDSGVDDGSGGKVPLFVDFQLKGEGGRTHLRLVHSGFGPDAGFEEEYEGISAGWPVELRSLRHYLEHHAGKDRRVVWATGPVGMDRDAAWQRLVASDAMACGDEISRLKEGDRFEFETCDGDVFRGRALHCTATEFTGVAESHGDGFLRLCVENCAGEIGVWIWLATYGAEGVDEGLQERWDAMVARVYPASAGVTSASGA